MWTGIQIDQLQFERMKRFAFSVGDQNDLKHLFSSLTVLIFICLDQRGVDREMYSMLMSHRLLGDSFMNVRLVYIGADSLD